MESAIANHEFEKARFYSDEERKERGNLKELRKKHKLYENPAFTVRPEEIERAVSKLLDSPDDLGSTST
jgi:ATP-dependent Clp protease ATP-binding subunit ClpC